MLDSLLLEVASLKFPDQFLIGNRRKDLESQYSVQIGLATIHRRQMKCLEIRFPIMENKSRL